MNAHRGGICQHGGESGAWECMDGEDASCSEMLVCVRALACARVCAHGMCLACRACVLGV